MSDQAALLTAIRNNPDEDTPRLIYADWLDENATADVHRARAELIRVQIELERMLEFGDATTETQRDELVVRQQDLLETYSTQWLRRVPVHNQKFHPHRVNFRRGFPETGSFHFDYLRQSAVDVFAHPLLRRIGVSPINEHALIDLLQCEWLAELRGLELSPLEGSGFPPPDWSDLGLAENLRQLDSLALNFGGTLSVPGAKQIAANSALSSVHTLCLKEEASTEAIPPLLDGVAFRSLSRLELKNFRGGRPPIPNLAANPRVAALEELHLVGYRANGVDIARLTESQFWKNLRIFDFSYGELGSAIYTLAQSRSTQLQSLTLTSNERFEGQGLCGPILWSLRSLDLSGNPYIGPEVVQYLADCSRTVGLWNLNLAGCGCVGDTTAQILATAPAFSQLRWLDLHNTGITTEGAKALAFSPQLERLGLLKLHGCQLGRSVKSLLLERFGNRVRW